MFHLQSEPLCCVWCPWPPPTLICVPKCCKLNMVIFKVFFFYITQPQFSIVDKWLTPTVVMDSLSNHAALNFVFLWQLRPGTGLDKWRLGSASPSGLTLHPVECVCDWSEPCLLKPPRQFEPVFVSDLCSCWDSSHLTLTDRLVEMWLSSD